MNNRLSKLRDALAQIGADALITEETVNRRYLSGFTGSTGWVIVTEKEAFLVTDFRYVDQAQEECPHFTVVNNERKPLEAIAQVLKKAWLSNGLLLKAACLSEPIPIGARALKVSSWFRPAALWKSCGCTRKSPKCR